MEISQLIYTSICTEEMTPWLSHQVSLKSISICKQLGLTGRVFANDQQALAMTEGQTDIVRRYYEAVKADPLVESILLHVDRPIKTREFSDYSVWLNSRESYDCGPQVHRLSAETLPHALPAKPSAKIRIMIEAYLTHDLLDA